MIIMTSGMDNGSWAPVPYDDEDNDTVQHGGLTPANKLTEACTLGLQRASCKVSNCIIPVGFITDIYLCNRDLFTYQTHLLE